MFYSRRLAERFGPAIVIFLLVWGFAMYREYYAKRLAWAKEVTAAWQTCDDLEAEKDFTKRWLVESEKRFLRKMDEWQKSLNAPQPEISLESIQRSRLVRRREELAEAEAEFAHAEQERRVNAAAWACRENHSLKYGMRALSKAQNLLR